MRRQRPSAERCAKATVGCGLTQCVNGSVTGALCDGSTSGSVSCQRDRRHPMRPVRVPQWPVPSGLPVRHGSVPRSAPRREHLRFQAGRQGQNCGDPRECKSGFPPTACAATRPATGNARLATRRRILGRARPSAARRARPRLVFRGQPRGYLPSGLATARTRPRARTWRPGGARPGAHAPTAWRRLRACANGAGICTPTKRNGWAPTRVTPRAARRPARRAARLCTGRVVRQQGRLRSLGADGGVGGAAGSGGATGSSGTARSTRTASAGSATGAGASAGSGAAGSSGTAGGGGAVGGPSGSGASDAGKAGRRTKAFAEPAPPAPGLRLRMQNGAIRTARAGRRRALGVDAGQRHEAPLANHRALVETNAHFEGSANDSHEGLSRTGCPPRPSWALAACALGVIACSSGAAGGPASRTT